MPLYLQGVTTVAQTESTTAMTYFSSNTTYIVF